MAHNTYPFYYSPQKLDAHEDLAEYCQFGAHPVVLGQILPEPETCVSDKEKQPQYRIIAKLGHGAFSTVWLARDLEQSQYVALKICKGESNTEPSPETRVLRFLNSSRNEHTDLTAIPVLFDDFVIKGPNGFHQCLVLEVVLPYGRSISLATRRAMRQIVQGFASLHELRVTHGDPYPANLGVAAPSLQQFEEEDLMDFFDPLELTPVIPLDPKFDRSQAPPYAVGKVSLTGFLRSEKALPKPKDVQVKIIDFGRSMDLKTQSREPSGAIPLPYRPPEVLIHTISQGKIGVPWSRSSDVFSAACLLFSLMDGPITRHGGNPTEKDALYDLVRYGGLPPQSWLEFWNIDDHCKEKLQGSSWFKPFEGSLEGEYERSWQGLAARLSASSNENSEGLGESTAELIDMLQKMMVVDPDKRITMSEVLKHPFWAAGQTAAELVADV